MKLDKITAFCEELTFKKLPGETVEMAKRCLLDYIGVSIAGYQTCSGQIALKMGPWLGQGEICTVFGQSRRVSPLAAAYINGTLSSALDLDDGHRGAVGHPGAMVITAALAAAEMSPVVSGREFIAAVVAGYEVAIRCGIVMNSGHEKRFYGSGGWAVFGAAAAAAKLLGLKAAQLVHAMTIGEVYGPTAQCGKSIFYGAMAKESIGWGVTVALFSTFLAREGFTGPEEILLDDPYYNIDPLEVFASIGKEYEIINTYFKRFASCRWSHSPITAALAIRQKHHPALSAIKRVRVETFRKALTLNHKSPHTTEAAQYSIPYTVAAALYHGAVGPAQVAENSLGDPQTLALAQKVELVHAADLERLFPAQRPARVTIEMTGGQTYTRETHLVPGDPEYPLSWDDLCEKFRSCTAPFLSPKAGEKLISIISRLEELAELKVLTGLLRKHG